MIYSHEEKMLIPKKYIKIISCVFVKMTHGYMYTYEAHIKMQFHTPAALLPWK
jgi:hypothetical protein